MITNSVVVSIVGIKTVDFIPKHKCNTIQHSKINIIYNSYRSTN